MNSSQRQKRLRRLVTMLNKERKRQAKKIDILCNDFIEAQRNFIKKLDAIAFAANFYEEIVGITNLNNLLNDAAGSIQTEIENSNVAFFLRNPDTNPSDFESHIFQGSCETPIGKKHLHDCITNEVVENICRANKVCTLEDILAMGLEGNPNELCKISAVTVPLHGSGPSLGFILIYRWKENKLTTREINHVSMITSGLSQAIQSCQTPHHSAK